METKKALPVPSDRSFQFTIYKIATGQVMSFGTTNHLNGMVPDDCDYTLRLAPSIDSYFRNGKFKRLPQSPGPVFVFDYLAEQWFDPRNIPQLRADKWAEIKKVRDDLEQAGFPYLGKVLDSDPVSVQRITTAVQAAQAAEASGTPFEISWTCADNTPLALDGPGMLGVPAALAAYGNSLHQTGVALRQAIEAATTPEAIAAITWP